MTEGRGVPRGDWLLSLWLALLGADRIDLLGGRGPVVLTPFLVLTGPVLVRELSARRTRRRGLTRDARPVATGHGALLLLLMALAAASAVTSLDVAVSAQRLALLLAQVGGASLVIWALRDDPRMSARLAAGARLGILLAIVADAAQALAFAGALPSAVSVSGWRVVDLHAFNYAGLIPRTSGLALDPNRGAYLAVVHLALVAAGPRDVRSRWIAVGTLALLGTLSRSGALAAGAALLVARLEPAASARPSVTPRRSRGASAPTITLALALVLVVVSGALLVWPTGRARAAETLAPAVERLSAAEGSARIHGMLLRRGVAEATRDVPRLLFGSGYGTSFLLLRDVFGTRYGNFHSLFLSFWVESGIIALLVLGLLLGVPARRAGRWRALLAATVVFNLFYQAGTEPALWAAIALAWQDGAA